MSAFSNSLELKIVNWLKGTTMDAAPTNTYVYFYSALGADTVAGGGDNGGTIISTINPISIAAADWTVTQNLEDGSGTYTKLSNSAAVTAAVDAGQSGTVTVVGFGVYSTNSSPGASNLLWYGATPSKTLAANDELKFNIGSLALQVY